MIDYILAVFFEKVKVISFFYKKKGMILHKNCTIIQRRGEMWYNKIKIRVGYETFAFVHTQF